MTLKIAKVTWNYLNDKYVGDSFYFYFYFYKYTKVEFNEKDRVIKIEGKWDNQ